MNIFILDEDFTKNAQYHVDKHVVKMITEHAQIMSTVCRLNGAEVGYKATHPHHPCVKWAGASLANWKYIQLLTNALHEEWKFRYKHPSSKIHKAFEVMLSLPIPSIKDIGLTPFAQAMPNDYKNEDAVKAYRDYYIGDKQHLASWKNREIPKWYK